MPGFSQLALIFQIEGKLPFILFRVKWDLSVAFFDNRVSQSFLSILASAI